MRNRATRCALLLIAIGSGPAIASEIVWDEKYFNPRPASDDVILPMPCGGAMAFRRISTSSADGAIGDVSQTLGLEGDAQPYVNGLRRTFVSGPFDDGPPDAGETYILMGKYEIAAAQFAAVVEDPCPKTPRRLDFLPATERSKLDFETFAERYSLWLLANAPEAPPPVEGAKSFFRLPTEDEWEFAARGGENVEIAEFRQAIPPMPEGADPSEYIAHGGTGSAGGKVQLIGTLLPNPVGLHDMIGNVAEIVATPFAAVRHGRLHGRIGGHVKRGGDARTPLSDLSSATRFEVAPIDALSNAPARDRYVGARLVLASVSIATAEEADALSDGLRRLAEIDGALPSAASEEEVLPIIAELQKEASSPRASAQLALIQDTIERARADRNAQRDKSLRLLIGTGTLICDQARIQAQNLMAIEALIPTYDELRAEATVSGDTQLLAEIDAARAEADAKMAQGSGRLGELVMEYANLVEGLAEDYSQDLIARQVSFVETEMGESNPRRTSCLRLMNTHVGSRRTAGFSDFDLIALDLRALGEAAAEQ